MTSYKQLLEAKYYYEVHLYDVKVKIYKMEQEGGESLKSSKYRKALQRKAELEASIQQIIRQLAPYEQIQKEIGPPPTKPVELEEKKRDGGAFFVGGGGAVVDF
jgi:hypothetical protein